MSSRALRAAQILWPAFVIAGILEMIVFAWVDPSMLVPAGLPLDEKGVYSLTFLVFWGFVSIAALLSHWLIKSADMQGSGQAQGQDPEKPGPRTRRQHHGRRQTRSMA